MTFGRVVVLQSVRRSVELDPWRHPARDAGPRVTSDCLCDLSQYQT
ncbi:hypothetical protein SAMN04515695_3707 [Pseudovibrio sp. Tun.PSC04-5.I4]|nr:hypothetical protein SAMN04515695_3707 [Pseudovibrio sp. Tun.PSC04-5.I4]